MPSNVIWVILLFTLEKPSNEAQVIVEVKAFAESFKQHIGTEAKSFYGVVTTGLIWRICQRKYFNGNDHYLVSEPIKDFDKISIILIDIVARCEILICQILDFTGKSDEKVIDDDKNDEVNDSNIDSGNEDANDDSIIQKSVQTKNFESKSNNNKTSNNINNNNKKTTKRGPLREIHKNLLSCRNLYEFQKRVPANEPCFF